MLREFVKILFLKICGAITAYKDVMLSVDVIVKKLQEKFRVTEEVRQSIFVFCLVCQNNIRLFFALKVVMENHIISKGERANAAGKPNWNIFYNIV